MKKNKKTDKIKEIRKKSKAIGKSIKKRQLEEIEKMLANPKLKSPKKSKGPYNKSNHLEKNNTLLSAKDVVKACNVDIKTVTRWKNAGLPFIKQNNRIFYKADEVKKFAATRGFICNIENIIDKSDAIDDLHRIKKAEADLKEFKARITKLELKEKEGQLINFDEFVLPEWTKRVNELKKSLTGMGNKLALILEMKPKTKIKKIIDTEIYNYLEQYSRHGKYTPKKNIKNEPIQRIKSTKRSNTTRNKKSISSKSKKTASRRGRK